jgi:hypothetical protein
MRLALILLALMLAFPAAAMACDFDTSTDKSQSEFRSSYEDGPASSGVPFEPWLPYAAGGAATGVVFLVGGVVMSQMRPPAERKDEEV